MTWILNKATKTNSAINDSLEYASSVGGYLGDTADYVSTKNTPKNESSGEVFWDAVNETANQGSHVGRLLGEAVTFLPDIFLGRGISNDDYKQKGGKNDTSLDFVKHGLAEYAIAGGIKLASASAAIPGAGIGSLEGLLVDGGWQHFDGQACLDGPLRILRRWRISSRLSGSWRRFLRD